MALNLKSLGAASAVVLAFGISTAAQAATVDTSGVWSNVSPASGISGAGTSQISWGNPFPPNTLQSSYVFAGVTNENVTLPPAGGTSNLFDLGTFTHNNFPITGTTLSTTTLNIAANFVPGGPQTFSFDFSHFETPNNANPCAAGGVAPCPDLVSFLNNGVSNETITIGGEAYNLIVLGFRLNDGSIANTFLTAEGQVNTAILQGYLGKPGDPPPIDVVPEPLTMLGAGAALGFGGFFKRKLSEKKNTKA